MGSRLELKYGLVAEADRLSTSADAMLANEPATGSKVRSKGNLYLVVSSAKIGGRAREATALVADTIRREYYYDESAGVPICLEKAIRSANRKLRGSREGGGLPPGVIGIAVAVVRSNELYVATIGGAEAYLVRAARLLMPDHGAAPGLPADDALRVDVWRGEIAVGDSLLLVARNLTEVVGTEELKNAVVTLHPQSAVEHLHHLFVAAGGDGPDAVLALEATELAPARGDRRLAPASSGMDVYGELAGGPIPGGDQVVGAASAVTGAFSGAAAAVTGAFGGAIDRVLDAMPRRNATARGVSSQVSRAETQRRAALALLALLGVILLLGVGIWVFPRGQESHVAEMTEGERAYRAAQDESEQARRMLGADSGQATRLYQQAWSDVQKAKAAGVAAVRVDPLAASIRDSLERIYRVGHPTAQTIDDLGDGTNPTALERGPDKAAYFIDAQTRSVWRVDPRTGADKQIIRTGDGRSGGIGVPRLLSAGGPDLLVEDSRSDLWAWRPSSGSLRHWRVNDDLVWGDDVSDIDTLLVNARSGIYNLYVIDPSSNQVLKYPQNLDGGAFNPHSPYLTAPDENVPAYLKLYIDGDLYTLTADDVVRHYAGSAKDYHLETPPDDGDLRPGHQYRLIDGTGDSGQGRLYVYDAKWSRILVFDKGTGHYASQWMTRGKQPRMQDIRGMYVVQQGGKPAEVTWVTPQGLYVSKLVETPDAAATPAPGATPGPAKTPKPTKKPH